MRYFINEYHDNEHKRYACYEIVNAENVESIKLGRTWFNDRFEAIADVELSEPTLFSASVYHRYSDGYDSDNIDYIKTLYVLAKSYKDAVTQLEAKLKEYNPKYHLGQIRPDSRQAIDILLSM